MKTRLPKVLRSLLLAALVASPCIYADDTTFTGGEIADDVTLSHTSAAVDSFWIAKTYPAGESATVTLVGTSLTAVEYAYIGQFGLGNLIVSKGSAFDVQLVNGGDMQVGSDAGAVGYLEITGLGSNMSVSGLGIIGNGGTGTLDINDGASASLSKLLLGQYANSDGKVLVKDSGSYLNVDNTVWVGYGDGGKGTISVENGATATLRNTVHIGKLSGSEGTVNVTGAGSLLKASNTVYVGVSGEGNLEVSDGGTADLTYLLLGSNEDGTGSVVVTGTDSSISLSENLFVGYNGTGTMDIEDGATATITGYLNAGFYEGSEGTINVTGKDTSLSVGTTSYVGYTGEGALNVTDGASADLQSFLYVGLNDGADGSVTVSGENSSLSVGSTAFIGYSGEGSLEVCHGATADLTWMHVGSQTTGVGTVTVSGTGSTLTASENNTIGNYGQGVFSVEEGGSATFSSNLFAGYYGDGEGDIFVSGDTSSLAVKGFTTLGLNGTGSLSIQDGAGTSVQNYLCVGQNANSEGHVLVTGSRSTLDVSGYTYIGFSGTGTLSIEGDSSSTLQNYLYIGYNSGSEGTVKISGANSILSVANTTIVGYSGTGSLEVSEGGHADLTWLNLGQSAGAEGTIRVTGIDSLFSTTKSTVVGGTGTGKVLVENGGRAEIGTFINVAEKAGSEGFIEVTGSGSTLSVGSYVNLAISGTGSLSVKDGGLASITGYLCAGLYSAGEGNILVTGADSTLSVSSTTYVGYYGNGVLAIQDNGTVNVLNELSLAEFSGSTGTVTVVGNSTLAVTKDTYVAGSGTGSLLVSEGAQANLSGLQIGYDSVGTGTVTVTGEGSSLTTAKYVAVGKNGEGSFIIQDSATATIRTFLNVGMNDDSTGDVQVSGEGTILNVIDCAYIGYNGMGTLSVSNGSTMNITRELQLGKYVGSQGFVQIDGKGTSLSVGLDAYIGLEGDGELVVSGGASVAIAGHVTLGESADVDQVGTGTITVTGQDSTLRIGDSLGLGYADHFGSGSLHISDGATVSVANSLQLYGCELTMDTPSTLTTGELFVALGETSTLTLGGSNNLGKVYIESENGTSGLSLNMVASGTSVTQGGIVVCDQLLQLATDNRTTYRSDGSMLSWADVSVSFDLTNDAADLIGNKIYLLKEGSDHEDFADGLIIEGVARDVSTDAIAFSKTIGDKTISFNYVYDGTSITFSDTMTVTNDQVDVGDTSSVSVEKVATIFSQDVIGTVAPSADSNEIVFTPGIDVSDHTSYVIAVGENAECTHFSIASTSYKKQNTYTYKNANGEVFKTEVRVEDTGITDLTLYVNGSDASIASGVVGLRADEGRAVSALRADSDEGVDSNLNNVLVKNGTLSLSEGNIVNADRRIQADAGTIVLDDATMNIGGGNLDEFYENNLVANAGIDWDALVDSTIENSTIRLCNGSAINFARVLDDDVTTEVVIQNSTVDICEDSSLNGSAGVEMSVKNSKFLGTGTVSNFSSTNNTYTAGKNNVGVLELMNIASVNDTMGTSIIGDKVVSGALNSDTTNVMSQVKLSNGSTVTNGTFQLNVVGDSSLLTDGTSFQVLDLEGGLDGGFTSFTETGSALMNGYVWDYSLLNSNGVVSVILAELGDGVRLANTMLSSAQTVSSANQVALDHLASYTMDDYNELGTHNNFWVSSLGTYQCVGNQGGRTGYTFQSMGYAVGYDRAFSNRVIEGLDVGQTWGKHRPKTGATRYSAGKIDQDAMLATLYGMETLVKSADGQDEISLQHAVSYGSVRNKSVKTALFNNRNATAKWDDHVWSFGVRGVWNHDINERWGISPFVGVDYEHVAQNSIPEHLANSTAHYRGGRYQNWDATLGAATNYTIKFDNNMELTPMASIAYVGSFSRNVPSVNVSNGTGAGVRERGVNPGRNAIEASAGVDWKVSKSVHVGANYSFYAAHDTTSHHASVTVNYAF